MIDRRISIVGVPMGLGAGCPGTERGAGAVRTAHLLGELQKLGCDMRDAGIIPVSVPAGPGDPKAKYLNEIAEACESIAQWMEDELGQDRFPLVIGGDHSISSGTVAGVSAYHRTRNAKIGLIWIDAHADMNTPETSQSGNVHGMPLAASLGLGAEALTRLRGFSPKVQARNAALVGIRDVEPAEIANIEQSGIRVFTLRDIDERGMFSVMSEAIEAAAEGTAGIHLSFDMDALDPTIAPGVGTPVPGGLNYREAHLALEMIADTHKLISMDVVEVNPMLDAENLTARMAVGLIASALGKSILPRRPV